MIVDIRVPSLGESVSTATVARWLKQVGQTIAADEPLVELETDKVTVEVNAPMSGVLKPVAAQEGDEVEAGALLGTIDTAGSTSHGQAGAAETTTAAPAKADAPPSAAGPVETPAEPAPPPLPAAAKLLTENNVANRDVAGSGKDGRVTKGDVLAFLDQARGIREPARSPAPRPSEQAGEERVKMTRLRRTIATRLKTAQNNAALLTTFNEIDMSSCMQIRTDYKDRFEKKHGVRLGFMSFFVKACVNALREFPAVNAEIDGDDVVYKSFVHMGIAVGGANGLVVPVIRNAQDLGLAEIEASISNFGKAARDGSIKLEDLSGGTFSITNGGVYGSLMSTPIVNPPQSAILGMHKIQDRPVAIAGQITIRPMMYLALTYDHRIIDGKEAVSFLVRVKEYVEDPKYFLLGL